MQKSEAYDMDSDNHNNKQKIDTSVGALLWVRRPNGSWWPGRVLGFDELPKDRSSKPGTPIKLLGGENGSMDWYNLERTTRLKAFRCGEYDNRIEKAKELALRSNRKAAEPRKYVRREDAILHALELEKARSFDKNQKFVSGKSSLVLKANDLFCPQSNAIRHSNDYQARSHRKHKKSRKKLSQSGMSCEHPSKPTASNTQTKRRRTPFDLEVDTTEGMKRLIDIQDLGSGIMLYNKQNKCVKTRGFHGLALPNGGSLSESHFDNELSIDHLISSSKDSYSFLKQKRTRMSQANESLKKKCRRRSLTEVWTGATEVKVQSLQRVTEIKVRADNTTSKKKDSPSTTDNSPDCSGTSCEEALFNTHKNTGNVLFDDDLPDSFIDVPVKRGDNATGLGEACSTSSSTRIDIRASDWHTKGKRNTRHPSKNVASEIIIGTTSQKKSTSDESLTSADSNCQQIKCKSTPKLCADTESINPKVSLVNDVLPPRKICVLSSYRVSPRKGSGLYDVELSVQSNYRGQLVPLVSLVNKFNGKAIVGHPVTVEVIKSQPKRKPSNGKKLGFSPRKIRRLSSFVLISKDGESGRKLMVEKIGPPAISCIPLKVVFSRLNEALSC